MGRIFGTGVDQDDLVDLISLITTNWNGLMAKIDADLGDTTYATTYALAVPSGIQTSNPKAIHNQGLVVTWLNNAITVFNGVLAALDSDDGVADTDYASLWAITDVVGNSAIDAVYSSGIYQGSVVNVLNRIIAGIAGLNAKLDDDGTITDTDYAATWDVADTVIEQGTYNRVRKIAMIFALGFSFLTAKADARPVHSGSVFRSSVAYDQNYTLDAGALDRFSMQAIYATGVSAGAQTFSDGVKSWNQLTITGTGNANANASIVINGVTVNFTTSTTTALEAQALSLAITNSSGLSGVVVSTHVSNVVYTTATLVGSNPYIVASSTAGLAWTYPYYSNGKEPDVSIANDTISTTTSHGFVTGQALLFSSATATTPIGGLVSQTTYYAISVTPAIYKLATTAANAGAGTAINLTTTTTNGPPGGNSWTFTPTAFSALTNNGLKWQVSNDKITWTDLSTVSFSSITYSSSGSTIWDFGSFNYKWLRGVFVAPTRGFINWILNISAKGDE